MQIVQCRIWLGDITKPGDIIIEFWEKTIQLHGIFHGLKITNWYTRDKGCFDLFYCLYVGFWTLTIFATCMPNWDDSDRIFKQIILVTSKAEEKIQKLYFYYSGNFDENMRRPHERDPPRIRGVIWADCLATRYLVEVPTSH